MLIKRNNYTARIRTDFKPVLVKITVGTTNENVLIVSGYDGDKDHTFFFSRYAKPGFNQTYSFGIPRTAKFLDILIHSQSGESFEVKKIEVDHLSNFKNVKFPLNQTAKKFQEFIKEFTYQFGEYGPGNYVDQNNLFKIRVVPVIHDTPTRIGQVSKVIEISKAAFDKYTVSQRALMLSHEFAHKYMNKDEHNEFEADRNGLMLYLAMKYPVIEAFYSFTTLTPNIFSYDRLLAAEKFLKQYETRILFNE